MNKNMQFTIGSDPELMLINRKSGKIVSSLPFLPDKYNPVELKNGIRVYSDNILVEASFPPVETKEAFIGIFRDTFAQTKKHLGDEFGLIPLASYVYDDSELKDDKAWEIGCTANFNSYTESMNPTASFVNGLRTGSAHIHIGNKKLCDFDMRHKAIRLLDIFVGCASVIFDKEKEASKARRKYYGAAGEFRPTKYGLEYRVLSPFVLRSPELVDLAYDLINYTMSIIENDETDNVLSLVNPKKVQDAINQCSVSAARKILVAAKIPKELICRIEKEYETDNFEKNWGI